MTNKLNYTFGDALVTDDERRRGTADLTVRWTELSASDRETLNRVINRMASGGDR